MTGTSGSQSKLATVLRGTSGNFLEMFDFFLFGFYASYIAKTFFPLDNDFASLMLTLMTFGAGFLMRPLGAIVLGGYVDRIGRLLQGFSAGAELGGVSVYLSEMATPGNKGFYVSWQSGSQQVAIIVAAAIGYALNQYLSPAA